MENVSTSVGNIAYLEQGPDKSNDGSNGTPTFVFLHGWTCSHRAWCEQMDEFASEHRCIAIDLPGHGDSDKPEIDYTMAMFAEAVEDVLDALNVERPVLVGHSMGGVIALEMARRGAQSYAAAVLVDPGAIAPGESTVKSMERSYEAMSGGALRETLGVINEKFIFIESDGQTSRDIATRDAAATPDHVVLSAWRGMLDWNGREVLAAVSESGLPLLHIASARPNNQARDLNAIAPGLVHGQTVCAGHFNQIDAAEQTNAMITKFLQVNGLA